ncbi:MAG: GAF domain-containing protein [Magnetococcales bacterium]|nr:GAF domain-containing protein [Magnetococcales bacterium]
MLVEPVHDRLLTIQLQLARCRDLEPLSPMIAQAAAELCDADRAALFLLDWERMELRARGALGVQGGIRLALKMGIVGLAFLRKEIVNVVDAYNVPFFNREIDRATGFKTETVLVAPIIDGGAVRGAVQLLNKKEGCFELADEEWLARQLTLLVTPDFFQALDADRAKRLVDALVAELRCERGTFFVLDSAQGMLSALYATGMEGRPAIGVRVNLGIAGWVVFTGQALVIEDAYQSEFFNPESDQKTGYRTRSIVAVPLQTSRGEPLGVLEIINKKGGHCFTEADTGRLRSLAAMAAVAVENAMLLSDQEGQFQSFIEVMADSIDGRDALTVGHSRLVSRYACGIAQELGLSDDDRDVVRVAALLHDYGKLESGVSGSVDSHLTCTREMLSKIVFSHKYRHVPAIAAAHHEYMDGSGHGMGLVNRYVPFLGKIITVANIFETLTADRHYRKRMSPLEALFILKQGAGKKFDLAIIEAMERYWLKSEGVVVDPVQRLEDLPVDAYTMRPIIS